MARRPHVSVVGLGPAGPELLTEQAVALLASPHAYLRTARHPAAAPFDSLRAFDHLYESAATFDAVYAGIVEELVEAARAIAPEPVVYAVPGSPLVAERTVELLRAEERVDVTIVPALSFLDLAWRSLGIDPVTEGVRMVDARSIGSAAVGPGPLLVSQCWSRLVLSDVKLALEDPATEPPQPVILHHLGLPDEVVVAVDWWELDRTVEADHLTSLYLPAGTPALGPAGAGPATEVANLVALMDTLRERCPWDRAQTHASLMPHLVEECYEVLDALAALDASEDPGAPDGPAQAAHAHLPQTAAYAHLQEELGDLLFQIVFHARLAQEAGEFDLADVALSVHDKLVHRHPHVFGDLAVDSAGEVVQNWEDIKKAEKGRRSVTEGIPSSLPALMLATKLVRKARSVGLDPGTSLDRSVVSDLASLEERAAHNEWHPDDPLSSVAGDLTRQVGDALFFVAHLAQRVGVDAEQALRDRALSLRSEILVAEGVPDQENGNR